MPTEASPIPPELPRVGVVTVSYGSSEALTVFLSSLRLHEGADVPVVVVDNKPDTDNVRSVAADFGALYVPLPHNPGYGAGMNAGVVALNEANPEVSFDAYFFCNPDVRFLAPVISGLARQLELESTAGSIGPQLLNLDGTVYPSARNIPSISTGVGHALFSRIWPKNPWSLSYYADQDTSTMRSAGSLSGAAVMTPRRVFIQLQGWDEAYFLHFEDIDLGWRIGKLGRTNLYAPQFQVEHSGAHSTTKHVALVERAQTQSAIRFLNKRYAGWWNAPLRAALSIGLHARLALKLRTLRPHKETTEQ